MKYLILLAVAAACFAQTIPTPNPGDPLHLPASGGSVPSGSNGDLPMKSGSSFVASPINCVGSACSTAGTFSVPATIPTQFTIAAGGSQLPAASSSANQVRTVNDATTPTDCATGGGSIIHQCISNGSAWITYGDTLPSIKNNSLLANVSGVSGAPVAVPFPTAFGALHAFGDSITANGQYVTSIAGMGGALQIIRAQGGGQGCDVANLQVFPNEAPSYSLAPVSIMMIGANDANGGSFGVGAYEAVFRACHQASLAWVAIPTTNKVYGQAAACVKSGTWANDDTYQTGIGTKSTTNASTLTCTITTTGLPIYAWYRIVDGNGGAFTYALDGGSATAVNAFTSPAIGPTGNSSTQAVALIRIPGVTAGSHTVTFTVTSSTGAGNIVSVLGVGSLLSTPYYQPPRVFSAGVTRQQNDTSAAATAAYNTDALADVTLLAGDGLLIYPVDVRAYVNSTTDMADTLHPNATGQDHLRDAFATVMQALPSGNCGTSTCIVPLPTTAYGTFTLSSTTASGGTAAYRFVQGPTYGLASYLATNGAFLLSSTSLMPGVVMMDNGTNAAVGTDAGYNNQSRYTARLWSGANIPDVCLSNSSTRPTAQSSFLDLLCASTTTNQVLIHAGNQTTVKPKLGGTAVDHFADVGNATTVETDLYSDSLAGSLLNTNGDTIHAVYGGTIVGSTSTKQIKIYFGGTAVFDSGALAISSNANWNATVDCVRASSSAVRCSTALTTNFATLNAFSGYTAVTGLTLTSAQILKITGTAASTGAATNDVVASIGKVSWQSAQ